MTNNKNLLNFFNQISKEQDKLLKMISYPDVDKMYEYAISESEGDFTKEEFIDALKEVSEISSKILSDPENLNKSSEKISKEISEENLENISGGAGDAPEEWHRSITNLANPAVNLVATLVDAGFKYKSNKLKDKLENENKDLTNALRRLKLLNTRIKIKEAEKILKQYEDISEQ